MILRDTTAADYAAIRDLLHDADAYHARALPGVWQIPPVPRFTQQELAEVASNTEQCFVQVAEHEGQVIGFVDASVHSSAEPEDDPAPWLGVNNLAVAQDWRRRGVATALLDAAEAWGRQRRLREARLLVYDFNVPALALYEGRGYRTLARQMSKPLSDAPS